MPLVLEKKIRKKNKKGKKRLFSLKYKIISDKKVSYIIQVDKLVKKYGKNVVLKEISFKANRGERIAIIGANGAGKTTLMETISQIRVPDSGLITYNFSKIVDPRTKIGFQFQESKYPSGINVKDILKFYSEIYHNNFNKKHLDKMLKIFKLDKFLKKNINSMSGGQQQRFNILLALFHGPELLILDELSTGLDIKARSHIKEFVKELIITNNLTLLLVSHNIDEAEFLCDRFIMLNDGKIIYDYSKKEIIKKYKTITNFVEMFFDQDEKHQYFGSGKFKI